MNAPLPPHLLPEFLQRETPQALIDALKTRFAERCSTALVVREQHGRDESSFTSLPPAAVVFAESTQDVADAVTLASQFSVPVIPFGVGTSLEGHLLAVQGGISIDVSRMNKVLAIHAEDLTVTVQPGVTRKQLNEEIKSTGLFFPIDPGADATLGGMSATRASGTNAVRYGTMRENVLALEVVTADGRIIRTGTRAKKSSAGYDLTRLMVGSEGTLGVITEVTVRLYPLPEAISAAICSFPSIEAAVRTTIEIIQLGVPIARVELIDANTVRMVNAHSKLGLREEAMLLMEFHGTPNSVKEQPSWCRNSPAARAAMPLNGPARPRSAPGCGRRGTTPTLPPSRASPAAGRFRPTPACRFRAWPTACWSRCLKPTPAAFPIFWSAMSATAISISAT
ncbi:FAD/FMN-containing dehydrogenase [Polaromonas sp. CG_23.6]|nr:FAD/FMN-containing dehydrogenase [Polaromonas sp. CG_23.6]